MSPALAGGFFTTEPPGKSTSNISYLVLLMMSILLFLVAYLIPTYTLSLEYLDFPHKVQFTILALNPVV